MARVLAWLMFLLPITAWAVAPTDTSNLIYIELIYSNAQPLTLRQLPLFDKFWGHYLELIPSSSLISFVPTLSDTRLGVSATFANWPALLSPGDNALLVPYRMANPHHALEKMSALLPLSQFNRYGLTEELNESAWNLAPPIKHAVIKKAIICLQNYWPTFLTLRIDATGINCDSCASAALHEVDTGLHALLLQLLANPKYAERTAVILLAVPFEAVGERAKRIKKGALQFSSPFLTYSKPLTPPQAFAADKGQNPFSVILSGKRLLH